VKPHTLVRVLIVLACLISTVSTILLPFLRATWGYDPSYRTTDLLWSFKKVNIYHQEWIAVVEEEQSTQWFADYWWEMGYASYGELSYLRWLEPVLIFTLEAQVLTVLFAFSAIVKNKTYLLLFPAISNVAAILFMSYISYELNPSINPRYTEVGFDVGFWLALISASLFLAAFALSRVWLKRKS